jgi:catechol 2,3-dioxygenase-like lactoylglutathione lyase family enzyme
VTKFYCDVLGFRESDWMADFFSFLRCGPDHHTINLMETGSNRHFHTAFELRDWAHLQTACDYLSLNGYKLLWGPGRHGIGHNLFAYHRSPAGLIPRPSPIDRANEGSSYSETRPWHRDNPQKPKVWARIRRHRTCRASCRPTNAQVAGPALVVPQTTAGRPFCRGAKRLSPVGVAR